MWPVWKRRFVRWVRWRAWFSAADPAVKAFSFRLAQALRWRETQVALQKARLAAAVGRVTALDSALEAAGALREREAREMAVRPDAAALAVYPNFVLGVERRLRDLGNEAQEARKAADAEVGPLVEANRKVRLLENLKRVEQGRWQRDWDRELGNFADEAYAGRLQSGKGRARSSAG